MNVRFDWTPRDTAGNKGHISAAASLDLPRRQIRVGALEAKYRAETVTLKQPFTLAFGPETSVDRVLLKLREGQVSVSGTIAPRLALQASAENVSPALLAPFVPDLSNEGAFSATAELSGTLANPEGTISMQGRGLRLGRYSAGVMPASLDGRAVLGGRSASVNAEIGSGAALKLSVTGNVSLASEHALDLNVQGQGELSVLNAELSAEGRSLQGQMALDLKVGGTASAPQFNGRATLSKGEFRTPGGACACGKFR
jgi:translocation and assembly module TamB